MSMPPQGPGGPPTNNPYGSGGDQPGGWDQNQNGWSSGGQHGWNQPGVGSGQGWEPNQAPQTDPYQQQYDAYARSGQGHPQDGYGTQQYQAPYDPSLSTASMSAPQGPGGPGGPGWSQPPAKSGNNKVPWIVGAAIIVVGAIVAVVLLVTGKDDEKSADNNDPTPGASQSTDSDTPATSSDNPATSSDAPSPSDEPDPTSSSSEPSAEPSDSGSSGSSLPASFPVPASVTIDDGSTYCAGNSCFGSFETDDPVAAYEDWVDALESAGYTLTTNEIIGTGTNATWAIEATGELEIIMYYAGTGVLTSS